MHRRIADSLVLAASLVVIACGETADEEGSVAGGSDSGGLDSGGSNGEGGSSPGSSGGRPGGGPSDDMGGIRAGGQGGAEPDGAGNPAAGAAGAEVAGGSGGSADGGSRGSDAGATGASPGDSLVGRAFDIDVPLRNDWYDWCAGDCEPATVLITSGTDTEMEIVWGATGRASRHLLTQDGDTWSLESPVTLGTEGTLADAVCESTSTLESAVFAFSDAAGDGTIDLEIAGHVADVACTLDQQLFDDFDIVLTGEPDARLPTVVVPPNPIEPTHGISFDLDKPLDPGATGTLVPTEGGDAIDLEPRTVVDGYVVGFDTARVLPLGARYTTRIVGTDFAGVGVPASVAVTILDDFGVLAPDGFESGANDGVYGGRIVQTYGVSAIDGQYMLLGPPGVEVLLRLQRAEDEQFLLFDARFLDECGSNYDRQMEVRAVVVGGDAHWSATLNMGAETTDAAVNGGTIWVGEITHYEAVLPAEGTDVLVYFKGKDSTNLVCTAQPGVLLDNVRLE